MHACAQHRLTGSSSYQAGTSKEPEALALASHHTGRRRSML